MAPDKARPVPQGKGPLRTSALPMMKESNLGRERGESEPSKRAARGLACKRIERGSAGLKLMKKDRYTAPQTFTPSYLPLF